MTLLLVPALMDIVASPHPPLRLRYFDLIVMSTADAAGSWELVVGPDGSVPVEQLARLGVAPGAHLRVVSNPASESTAARKSLAGVLRDRIDDAALDRIDDAALAANRQERI